MTGESAGFELRDHTADLALYVWGVSLPDLFLAAGDGLYESIGQVETDGDGEAVRLRFEAIDHVSLLQDFLSELLFRFETRGERVVDMTIESLDDRAMVVRGCSRKVSISDSILDREVKAVTYHDLEIVEADGRFEVTIVLDI